MSGVICSGSCVIESSKNQWSRDPLSVNRVNFDDAATFATGSGTV
jgi:hypothetical protein